MNRLTLEQPVREVLDVAHTLENDRGPACQGAEEALSPTEESFSPTSPLLPLPRLVGMGGDQVKVSINFTQKFSLPIILIV